MAKVNITCQKIPIPFPEHWEVDKWNTKNAPSSEEVEIRITSSFIELELIANQCVNLILSFLCWNEQHVNINCYKKTNTKNENVYVKL